MGDIIRLGRTPHDEAQLLLPWYVNGTLRPDEIAQVEAHLAECLDCRLDVEAERALSHDIAGAAIGPEREASRVPRRSRTSTFLRRRVPVGWMLAPVAAAAMVLAIFAPATSTPPPAAYEALGAPGEQTPAGNVVIVFDPARSEREMRAALLQVDARIVDGPNASGAYVLSVPDARRTEALASLRSLPGVLLAEPIDRGP